MSTKIIRGLFICACIAMGGLWSFYVVNERNDAIALQQSRAAEGVQVPLPESVPMWTLAGCLAGGVISGLIIFVLAFVTQELFEKSFPALVAIVVAMLVGYFLARYILMWYPVSDRTVEIYLTTTLVLVFGYVGIWLGLSRATHWDTLIQAVHRREFERGNPKLVDTSVIIDGRIAEVCQTGFVEGTLIVPRFVLKELQNIADSADELRRVRGRRGLDILKQLQQPDSRVVVEVIEDDPPGVQEVDGKLIYLAREFRAKILTNDLNLNKVAQIDGIEVLNLNDLANALKPALLPDEQLHVRIVKEGKEALQGVGYLDDGTMVVVDGGKEFVGKEVMALVTSVLQTTAGRMIFGKLQRVVS